MVFTSAPVFAQTSADTQAQIDSINGLTTQIKTLQNQRKTLVSTLVTQLKQGTQSDAVTALQELLALDSSIYPEGLVTGYFGKLTAAAVKKFQAKNGLEQVGYVGPKTLEKLKQLANDNGLTVDQNSNTQGDNGNNNGNGGKKLCAIVPPGHLIAKGWLKRNDGKAPTIPECQTLPQGIKDQLDGTKSNSGSGNNNSNDNNGSNSQTDITAPVISNLSASSIKTTEAKISWNTNEKTTAKVWYSTVNSVVTSGTPNMQHTDFSDSHSFDLSGLTVNTAYFYVVSSADHSGNVTMSAQGTFTTATQ